MNEPFFIVGVHRSGTTLLRYMLNSSPRIYIPPESDFIPRFFGRALRRPDSQLLNQPLAPEQVEKLLHIIFTRYRFVRAWQGPPPDPALFGPRPTPADFLDTLYRRYAAQQGAVRWGDKTPIYTSYLPLLDALFPQARFVHIIRDGRDVALSALDTWGAKEPHVDIYFTARNWVRRVTAAQAAGVRLGPGRYREVRYEALTTTPEEVLLELCAFLDEPYTPDMARPHELARREVPAGSFHDPVRRPPAPDRIGRWQREMSPADRRLFEALAGPTLAHLGYPVVGEPVPWREQPRQRALRLKYGVLQAGRSALQRLGLMPPI